jgi:flagellin
MGLVVNTNVQSLFAQRALSKNTAALKNSTEHLATGFRINKASDDAAGLSISEKMTSEIKGLEKAKQNSSDGISLVQTAEGALAIIQDNLQRIRELVVQGSNGTNGLGEQNAIQREINERITTIEDISKATKFNGVALLNSVTANITLQSGSQNGQTTTVAIDSTAAGVGIEIDVDSTANGTMGEGASIALSALKVTANNASAVGTQGGATGGTALAGSVSDIDLMINNLSRMRSYLGAIQNSLESKIEYLDVATENVTAARSRIRDIDVASESSILIRNQILQQSAAAMLAQANAAPKIAIDLLPRG